MLRTLQICLSPSEGGLELSTLHFAQLLSDDSFQSPVFGLKQSFIAEKAQNRKIRFVGTKKLFLIQLIDLYRELSKNQYEAVLLHRLKDIRLFPILKIFFPNLKVVGLAHIYVDRSKQDFLHRFLYSYFDRLLSFTEVQSLALQKTLPIPAKKHFVLPHGIDTNRFVARKKTDPQILQKRQELNVSEEQLLIGVVGRFDVQKGQLELVEAALSLSKEFSHLVFVFVGEDTFNEPGTKQKCLDLVQASPFAKHFHFLPFTNEIQFFYPALDLFVMPSYKETFGLVLIEAMACGCPVMSTNAGGPVEILGQGEYGLLVEAKSSKALYEGMKRFILDANLRSDLSQKARLRASTCYSQEIMKSKLSQFLLELGQSK